MRNIINPQPIIIGLIAIVVLISLLTVAITCQAANYHGSAYGAAVGVYGQQRNHDAYYYGMDRFNLGHQFARRGEYRFDQGCVDHEEDSWTNESQYSNELDHGHHVPPGSPYIMHDDMCDKNGVWGHWD